MIKPTIFIGLGTTGANILGNLQELIMQEFQTADVELLQMVSFITGAEDRSKSHLPHPEKNVVLLRMPDKSTLDELLKSQSTLPAKALATWFPARVPERIAEYDSVAAGNLRVIGRLFFWSNYPQIKDTIEKALRICYNNTESVTNAIQMLQKLDSTYKTKPQQELVEKGLNIFVVGSLCGGSCSGMMADFGFMLKEGLNLKDNSNVKIFAEMSIYNAEQAARPNYMVRAGNCYTALEELNSYYHASAKQSVNYLPDGTVLRPGAKPYDIMFLMSSTTMNGDKLLGKDQDYDREALEQEIAMDLFLKACAGTSKTLAGLRADDGAMVRSGLYEPDEKYRLPRAFCSLGVSAICYPKFGLARSASARLAQKVIGRWLDGKVDDVVVDKLVKEAVSDFSGKILPELGARKGEASLVELIRKDCALNSKMLQMDATRLYQLLRTFPSAEEPMIERFKKAGSGKEGDYHAYVRVQCQRLVEHTNNLVQRLVRNCRIERNASLPTVEHALQKFKSALIGLRKGKEATAVWRDISLTELDGYFSKLRLVERDFWLRILFVRPQAIAERKKQIMDLFLTGLFQCMRTVIAEYEIQLIDQAVREVEAILTKVAKERGKLHKLFDPSTPKVGALVEAESAMMARLQSPPRNMLYLFSEQNLTPQAEVSAVEARFPMEDAERVIQNALGGRESVKYGLLPADVMIMEWQDHEPISDLADKMLDSLSLEVLAKISGVNVFERIKSAWNDGCASLASYAAPGIEFTSEYNKGGDIGVQLRANLRLTKPRDLIFAAAANEGEIMKYVTNRIPTFDVAYPAKWSSEILEDNRLAHYLIFYREEAWFSTALMSAMSKMKRQHERKYKENQCQPEFLWTNRTWGPPQDGPDLWSSDRADYLSFLVNTAWEVLPDAQAEGQPLFKQDLGVYIEMPRGGELAWVIPVGMAKKADLNKYADKQKAREVIPYLLQKLTLAVRHLGQGIDEAQRTFAARCDAARKTLMKTYMERNAGRAEDPQAKVEHEIACERINMFLIHMQEMVFIVRPSDEEAKILRKYTWMRDWRDEKS
jgi:hypothetical protein